MAATRLVREAVAAVRADAAAPLRSEGETIRRAERALGHHIAPSSVRSCLREHRSGPAAPSNDSAMIATASARRPKRRPPQTHPRCSRSVRGRSLWPVESGRRASLVAVRVAGSSATGGSCSMGCSGGGAGGVMARASVGCSHSCGVRTASDRAREALTRPSG